VAVGYNSRGGRASAGVEDVGEGYTGCTSEGCTGYTGEGYTGYTSEGCTGCTSEGCCRIGD
jgi:hypothetical protein